MANICGLKEKIEVIFKWKYSAAQNFEFHHRSSSLTQLSAVLISRTNSIFINLGDSYFSGDSYFPNL